MPTITEFRPGQPCWIERATTNAQQVQDFYGPLFGWEFEVSPDGIASHRDCTLVGAPIAGISLTEIDEWLVVLAVSDAEATRTSAVQNGATGVILDTVGGRGTMVMMEDPTGAYIGGWQARSYPGFGVLGEPGAPVWFEVVTTDFAADSAFYSTVFGWDLTALSDTSELRYSTFGTGDTAVAGIQDGGNSLGAEQSHWVVYFEVADTDLAVAQALELGGTLRGEITDSPFGRLAQLVDPGGCAFRVSQHP